MSQPAKRVTIREVADAAGVSPAAVSYALRGIQVSEETQERVRQLADELGYEANPIARALASGRSGMVGVLGPSVGGVLFQHGESLLWSVCLALGVVSAALLVAGPRRAEPVPEVAAAEH